MSANFPEIYLVRHGETEWSLSGQHTGRTDMPLTPAGEEAARLLRPRLANIPFHAVWTSPSQRAMATCELAGFGVAHFVDPDLEEWDYGQYEGLTTKQILADRADWRLFQDGCPGGEKSRDVGARADAIISRLRQAEGSILIFSSSHFLRVLGARWLGMRPAHGSSFILDTTSISVLGYEHDLSEPVIRRWNGN